MKALLQNRERRAEFSAALTVMTVLAIGASAKLGLAAQFFRLIY